MGGKKISFRKRVFNTENLLKNIEDISFTFYETFLLYDANASGSFKQKK